MGRSAEVEHAGGRVGCGAKGEQANQDEIEETFVVERTGRSWSPSRAPSHQAPGHRERTATSRPLAYLSKGEDSGGERGGRHKRGWISLDGARRRAAARQRMAAREILWMGREIGEEAGRWISG